MEAVLTSETSVDNHFTRKYIPEDNSEHRTSQIVFLKVDAELHVKSTGNIIQSGMILC
jgi:hypothetical protein